MKLNKKRMLSAALVGLISAGTLAACSHLEPSDGKNACKTKSSCKGQQGCKANNSCKANHECKFGHNCAGK